MKRITLLSILFCCCFAACTDKQEEVIHPDLQPYFELFKMEAEARNVVVNFSDPMIEAEIVDIVTGGVLGQCVKLEDRNHLIHIQKSYWYANSTTDLDKEFVVFHELGHCTLEKNHFNTPDSLGNCISIMYDGNSTECTLQYNAENRSAMLDELFGS